jgi:hypothetical protein
MDNELYHYGVKGQKWGVRNNKRSTSSKVKRGSKYVSTKNLKKVAAIVSSTTAIASGVLWVASAFVPGMAALNTAAAIANVTSMATAPK